MEKKNKLNEEELKDMPEEVNEEDEHTLEIYTGIYKGFRI